MLKTNIKSAGREWLGVIPPVEDALVIEILRRPSCILSIRQLTVRERDREARQAP